MTKVEAIEKCLVNAGGAASLKDIYDNIEKYYPTVKKVARLGCRIARGALSRYT